MRIVCPSCHAAYEVPDSVLAQGPARVRCARCAKEWLAEGSAPPKPPPTPFADALAQTVAATPPAPREPAPLPPLDPPPEPRTAVATPRLPDLPPPPTPRAETLRRPPTPPPRSASDGATLFFAWSLSIAVLVAALVAAYLHHDEIVALWPPAERIYSLIGLR